MSRGTLNVEQKVQASEERKEDSLVKIALRHKKCREQASYAACYLSPRRTTENC